MACVFSVESANIAFEKSTAPSTPQPFSALPVWQLDSFAVSSLSMGARTAISLEEYLHTSYDGLDCEFRDGGVVERSMPTYSHGTCQGMFFAFFIALKKAAEPVSLSGNSTASA